METILIVDDEPEVLGVTSSILRAEGYTIIATGDPREALRIARSRQEPLDLLLTDVVMPQMSGPELAREVAELRPGTKVVYMSGYTDDALGHHGVLDPDIILLPKPFTPASLMSRLRLALDAQGPRS